MSTTGKHNTQTPDEITRELSASVKREIDNTRGQSRYRPNYKEQSGEYVKAERKEVIAFVNEALTEAMIKKPFDLSNTEELKKRIVVFAKACEETGAFPSTSGLARSLGYSDRALRYWREKHPNSETARLLEIFSDACVDSLNQCALSNIAHPIVSMFINKAFYGKIEKKELILTPSNQSMDEEYSVEDIKKRYLIEELADE